MQNIVLLKDILRDFGFKIAMWSFADTVARRTPFENLYHKTHGKRYGLCKNYILKSYADKLKEEIHKYSNIKAENLPKLKDDYKIWVFWWQGLDSAPKLVKDCVDSIIKHSNGHEVVIITKDNIKRYANLPSYIYEKTEKKQISLAQLSDILRAQLLSENGGIWADSTLLMTEDFTSDAEKHSFFTIKHKNSEGWHISNGSWAGFFLAGAKGDPVLSFCREMLFEYWKREKSLICYLLIDCIFSVGYDLIPVIKAEIDAVPKNNTGVFDLLHEQGNMICSDEDINSALKRAYIHKLTYKEKFTETLDGNATLYGKIKQIALYEKD